METVSMRTMADRIRRDTFESIIRAQSGHIGGSLSMVEILTVLYSTVLRLRNSAPERDRFILSKGHGAPALYATMANVGLIDPGLLKTLRQVGSPLQGHPDCRKLPGLEISSGSLGQGLSVAVGVALGQLRCGYDSRTYVLLGDGELDEGQVWEAAMAAAHFGLTNLTAVVDRNGLQLDGKTDEVMALGDLALKWKAFGWDVREVDGHDLAQLQEAFLWSAGSDQRAPSVIIARTVKGKGVSFIEGRAEYHGGIPSEADTILARKELREGVVNWLK